MWTYLDVDGMVKHSGGNRQRVIAAIEYFNEKSWIDLQSKQATDVYEILSRAYDSKELSRRFFRVFKDKETHEIGRIASMISFFESDTCLSNRLAGYFGEECRKQCGHCSVCRGRVAEIKYTSGLRPLAEFNPRELLTDFKERSGSNYSVLNATKFLCGLSSPGTFALKAKSIPNHSMFGNYPFMKVYKWIASSGSSS